MNRSKLILTLAVVFLVALCSEAVETTCLRCEYLTDPPGIDAANPRLSWLISSSRRGEKQTAFQILVASSVKLLQNDKGDLWDSGKVISDETSQIIYSGSPLISRQTCFWKVRSWDRDGKPGDWSPAGHWQMGLLQPADWSAKWITAGKPAPLSSARLVIRRATYEAVEEAGAADVTAALASQVKQDRLVMVVNNKTLGVDPARNLSKRLRVEYELGGRLQQKEIRENQTLVLPEEPANVPYLRKPFELNSSGEHAILYASALGLYEVHINGKRVGDHVLAPDWTDYRKRVRYQAYDVTALVERGKNAMGALLANGWYSGHIGNGGNRFFGKEPAFIAQLEVTYTDGRIERIVTDNSWKSHPGPILASDFMLGEDYDARQEVKGWDQAGMDENQWMAVNARDESTRAIEAQVMEPVRQIFEITPKAVTEPKPGCWVFDLGQNMVGVVRLKVSEPAGTKVTLRHAEMLNPNGTIYTKNLRGAPSIDH